MIRNNKQKKKHNRSLFYRISAWLHLWLGLATGAVVIVVCLTGCIWLFNEEITLYLLEPETRIAKENRAVLTPSQIEAVALRQFPGKQINYATYRQGSAIEVGVNDAPKKGKKMKRRGGAGASLKIHPYTGAVIKAKIRKEGDVDFFRMILNGHRFLWLPYNIGRPIVNYSILIFLVIMISGLVLWWPKKWTKATKDASFKIKWDAKFKRLNYDLHNVLGFYSLVVLLVIGTTGIVYGIEWFSKGLYWVTSGTTETLADRKPPFSDSTLSGGYSRTDAMDIAWAKTVKQYPDAEGFYYAYPEKDDAKAAIALYIYPSISSHYQSRGIFYDRHTAKQLVSKSPFDKDFNTASFAARVRKMNYDMHIGTILGLPGRIMAFFAALIGASLPVTGFLVWLGKKKKTKKTPGKVNAAAMQQHAVTQPV